MGREGLLCRYVQCAVCYVTVGMSFQCISMFIDIDECTIDNGGCQQICHNVEGSRACDCEDGYTRDDNLITCTGELELNGYTFECHTLIILLIR